MSTRSQPSSSLSLFERLCVTHTHYQAHPTALHAPLLLSCVDVLKNVWTRVSTLCVACVCVRASPA